MADVAGREPAVLQHPRRLLGVAPIAVHDEFAADHDLTVLGDPHFGVLDRRAHSLEANAGFRTVAAYDRRRLGLPIALEEGDPQRLEEDTYVGIEGRSARDPCLHPSPDLLAKLAAQGQLEDPVHRPIPRLQAPLIFIASDLKRPLEQISRKATARFHALEDARAEHLEQPRYDDHDRGPSLLDVGGELFQALRIIDLGAKADREQLPAGVLERVAGRKDRKTSSPQPKSVEMMSAAPAIL